jgi:hypothetical protein
MSFDFICKTASFAVGLVQDTIVVQRYVVEVETEICRLHVRIHGYSLGRGPGTVHKSVKILARCAAVEAFTEGGFGLFVRNTNENLRHCLQRHKLEFIFGPVMLQMRNSFGHISHSSLSREENKMQRTERRDLLWPCSTTHFITQERKR